MKMIPCEKPFSDEKGFLHSCAEGNKKIQAKGKIEKWDFNFS
jgi:hypothetical protein